MHNVASKTRVVTAFLLMTSCVGQDTDPAQRATEIVSTRTVGLAYLEENRLPEAELEFKKLIELAPEEYSGYANLGLVYLRMNQYPEAEGQLDAALARQPGDPGVHLLLSEVYKVTGRTEEAIDILEAGLQESPDDKKILYSLSQVHDQQGNEAGATRSQEYLTLLVDADSANLAARLQLTETMVRNGHGDRALVQLEEIRAQVPDLPREAIQFFDQATELLLAGETAQALSPMVILHNFMKVTPRYQQGLMELQGPGGASVGFPIFTFSRNLTAPAQTPEEVLAAIRFTDATEAAGLDRVNAVATGNEGLVGHVAVADFDYDGDQDLHFIGTLPGGSGSASYLFRNDFGHFSDITAESGLSPTATGRASRFDDFDNDSLPDLYVAGDGANQLFRNRGDADFRDVTRSANVIDSESSRTSVFVDLDHDGDLDLYVGNSGPNRFFRNNGDGTFTDVTEQTGVAGGDRSTRNVSFADFDEDGDTDLFVVNDDADNILYTNLRQGSFADISSQSGLTTGDGSWAVAVGDYDNDGFMDLFSTGHTHRLYRNSGDGTFQLDERSSSLSTLQGLIGFDAVFFDFDNDGYLDLFVVGDPGEGSAQGMHLFHNDGTGRFESMSDLLPENDRGGLSVAIADYNEDGDLDLFVADLGGTVRLLRNDGGSANRSFKIQLRGLTAGSGKNNYYGIGAKLEVRAGDLYQTRIVTSPMNHFGLGGRLKADVVRTVWTNGVPQNSFFQGSDQDLIEEQVLKGSCGFLYVWNGKEYTFLTDMVWRSALGMPMGIMGGRAAFAPPHPSREYLLVPGGALVARDGAYSIQVTEELWETLYLDEIRLVVVDHPESVDIFIDEGFVPTTPEIPDLELIQVDNRYAPKAAYDDRGRDWLEAITRKDDVYVSGFTPDRYQGVTELHDLILEVEEGISLDDDVRLFLNGWIFPTDASINVAMSQSEEIESIAPYLQVPDAEGQWQTVIEDMSFPMGKSKTMIVDLSGKFLSRDHRIRIRTNMEIYWDYAFFANRSSDSAVILTTLDPGSADLHYRGFSRMYRKGGPYGPHWFDYQHVTTEPRWIDMAGYYTRFGDVRPLLADDDSKYVIMNAGDELTIEFAATALPRLPKGWSRDYLIYSTGWLKDADINTGAGQTVEPLPFHGMSSYPYGAGESYPTDEEHQRYLEQYNTRRVQLKKRPLER